MFKKISLVGAVIMALSSTAHAADSVDMKVSGTLVNGSCSPSLENGGVVDLGHIPLGNLSRTDTNRIGQKNITLTITCDTEIPVAWNVKDNRSDSLVELTVKNAFFNGSDCSASANKFGIGKTENGLNIGAYCISVNVPDATVDGNVGDVIYKNLGSSANGWSKTGDGSARNYSPNNRYLSIADVGSLIPKAGKVFVYPLMVTAAIQATDILSITDNTILDGSATISMVYI
ncbi:DUF1120 domain-containing protein [Cronobacter turicensis]|uniref:DUF1120 domain-containing protein n=1 Tax=Cronobacter turicensis TaxID=413502 RepID=UPI0011AC823B|nr:DUF1120 domain-containing protein [Cronobacter turicensis]TWR36690.1 DUF1120 domain-containing protein [Cronobacter turicensis]